MLLCIYNFSRLNTAASFVDHIRVENAIVGNGNRVVSTLLLLQPKAGIGTHDRLIGDGRSGPGVDDVHTVLVAEIVVNAQCSCIDDASTGQNRVISGNAPTSVNGRTNTDFREVRIDQSLGCGVQQPRRNRNELLAETSYCVVGNLFRGESHTCRNIGLHCSARA